MEEEPSHRTIHFHKKSHVLLYTHPLAIKILFKQKNKILSKKNPQRRGEILDQTF
jgi:hypothetical protein